MQGHDARMAVILLSLLITLLGCGGGQREYAAQRKYCVSKGIEYYQQAGIYPTLSTGQSAEAAVKERCDRNVYAFGENPNPENPNPGPLSSALIEVTFTLVAGWCILFYIGWKANRRIGP